MYYYFLFKDSVGRVGKVNSYRCFLFKRSAHSAGPVHMSVVVHVPGLGSPKKRQFRNNFENFSMISAAPGTNFDARGVLFGFLETLGVSVDGRRKSKSSEASLF